MGHRAPRSHCQVAMSRTGSRSLAPTDMAGPRWGTRSHPTPSSPSSAAGRREGPESTHSGGRVTAVAVDLDHKQGSRAGTRGASPPTNGRSWEFPRMRQDVIMREIQTHDAARSVMGQRHALCRNG